MNSFFIIIHFFLSQLIWGITWGIGQIPMNIIIMTLILSIIVKMKKRHAITLSLISNLIVFFIYTTSVYLVCIKLAQLTYSDEVFIIRNTLIASLVLGLTYAVLQGAIFIAFFWRFYNISRLQFCATALISNLISGLLIHLISPMP